MAWWVIDQRDHLDVMWLTMLIVGMFAIWILKRSTLAIFPRQFRTRGPGGPAPGAALQFFRRADRNTDSSALRDRAEGEEQVLMAYPNNRWTPDEDMLLRELVLETQRRSKLLRNWDDRYLQSKRALIGWAYPSVSF
jgi:hypothetical protein